MDFLSAIIFEAFTSIFMSFFVLKPLAELLHPEDSKKYFWKFFWVRVGILFILDLINPMVASLDFFAVFIGAFLILPISLIVDKRRNKNNNFSSNYTIIKPSKVSDPNVHDSKIALTEDEQKNLKEKILDRLKDSGMDEETVKEKFKSVNEYMEDIKNSAGGYSNLTSNVKDYVSEINEIPIDMLDLSNLYPDYKEEYTTDTLFVNKEYGSLDIVLDQYIGRKINDKNALHTKNIGQIRVARIILSLITFLNISYICLYHENLIICLIIQIIAFLIYRHSKKKMNIISYIKKEIMARPNDNMNYIIESAKQNMILSNNLGSKYVFPLMLILCAILFFKPHIIYEKNDTGYSVRYYTLAILNDEKVEIPNEYKGEKVTEIRGKTFYNMFMLKEVQLPKYITEIRGDTFEYSGLERIEIPEGVTRIGGHAFYGCENLSYVSIPDSLIEIGSSAFRRCTSLTHIRIPQHTSVNERAFKESPTQIERYEIDE